MLHMRRELFDRFGALSWGAKALKISSDIRKEKLFGRIARNRLALKFFFGTQLGTILKLWLMWHGLWRVGSPCRRPGSGSWGGQTGMMAWH